MDKLLRSKSEGVVNWQNREIENQVQKHLNVICQTIPKRWEVGCFLMTYLVQGRQRMNYLLQTKSL